MERMTDYKPQERQDLEELYRKQNVRINELEKENKKLKEYNGELIENHKKDIAILCEENKKLKEDNKFLTKISKEYMGKENIIQVTEFTQLYKDELEEENKKLKEMCGKLGEMNCKFGERVNNLAEENKKLKADLRECECSMNFENDEVGYRKRECKKLKELVNEIHRDKEHILGEKLILQEENENMREEMKAMERTLDHLGYGERTY